MERNFMIKMRGHRMSCVASNLPPGRMLPLDSFKSNESRSNVEQFEETNRIKGLRLRKILKKAVSQFRNLVVSSQVDQKEVKEEWEREDEQGNEEIDSRWLMTKLSLRYFIVQLTLLIITVYVIWCWSIESIFQSGMNFIPITVASMLTILVDIGCSLNTAIVEKGKEIRNRWIIFKRYVKWRVYVDVVLLLVAATHNFIAPNEIMGIVASVLLFIKLFQHHENMKSFMDGTFSKEHLTLFGSFVLLLGIAHVFGLMMFAVSSASDKNWLAFVRIDNEAWDTQYIYSIYWAITTIVTVGYGDITPQNKYEVLVVILVEIIGTSIFGYMINVIGMSLTEMKRERETLDHELSVADKICKCFNINSDLAYRMKNFITNNHKVDRTFSVQQEEQLIEKLNPMLRNDILKDTNTRVIRKSVFFLTYFSWTIQHRLSLKLLKKIVQPTEVLQGQGSIYIIDKGELVVQLVRCHRSRDFAKSIKIISGNTDQNTNKIGNNAYGYARTITGRKVSTKAIGKCFSIAFELKRNELHEVVQNGSLEDYEDLCLLRDKFGEFEDLEKIEAPELADPRKHYQPNKSVVPLMKCRLIQPRRFSVKHRRSKLIRFKAVELFSINFQPEEVSNDESQAEEICEGLLHQFTIARPHNRLGTNFNFEVNHALLADGAQRVPSYIVNIDNLVNQTSFIYFITDNIKSYDTYKPAGNVQKVLEKYNTLRANARLIKLKNLARYKC